MKDSSLRFSLEQASVRGVYVTLNQSCKDAVQQAAYPDAVNLIMREFLVATAAIAELSLFEGTLTLQARSDQGISLIMADYKDGNIRAITKGHEKAIGDSLMELLPKGILTLTLDPIIGKRYQGIIPLDQGDLSQCLSDYFSQSEQLKTSVKLIFSEHGIAALMLQAVPNTEYNQLTDDQWQSLQFIVETLKPEEIDALSHQDVLYRLFHEYGVRVFEQQDIRYHCGCSKQKMENALLTLNYSELVEMIENDGKLQLNCDFCGNSYDFFQGDVDKIFERTPNMPTKSNENKLH